MGLAAKFYDRWFPLIIPVVRTNPVVRTKLERRTPSVRHYTTSCFPAAPNPI